MRAKIPAGDGGCTGLCRPPQSCGGQERRPSPLCRHVPACPGRAGGHGYARRQRERRDIPGHMPALWAWLSPPEEPQVSGRDSMWGSNAPEPGGLVRGLPLVGALSHPQAAKHLCSYRWDGASCPPDGRPSWMACPCAQVSPTSPTKSNTVAGLGLHLEPGDLLGVPALPSAPGVTWAGLTPFRDQFPKQ